MPFDFRLQLTRERTLFLMVAAISLLAQISFTGSNFWDFGVYRQAMHAAFSGGNPYNVTSTGLHFVYPPFFVWVFASSFLIKYLLLCIFLIIPFLIEVTKDLRKQWVALSALLVWGGWLSAQTGNITLPAHLGLIALSFHILRKPRNYWLSGLFCVEAVFMSLIKPYFLAYALVPIALDSGGLLASLGIMAATGLGYLLQWKFDHAASISFIHSLRTQLEGGNSFGYMLKYFYANFGEGGVALASVANVMIFGAILVSLLWPAWYNSKQGFISEARLSLILAVVIAMSPRIKVYDFSALAYCVYLFFLNIPKSVGGAKGVYLLWIALGAATLFLLIRMVQHFGVLVPHAEAVLYLGFCYGSITLGIIELRRASSSPRAAGSEPAA